MSGMTDNAAITWPRWTHYEEQILIALGSQGVCWNEVAERLNKPGKTAGVCQAQYEYLLDTESDAAKLIAAGALKPSGKVKRLSTFPADLGALLTVPRWSSAEDDTILRMADQEKTWNDIEPLLSGKTALDISKRFFQALYDFDEAPELKVLMMSIHRDYLFKHPVPPKRKEPAQQSSSTICMAPRDPRIGQRRVSKQAFQLYEGIDSDGEEDAGLCINLDRCKLGSSAELACSRGDLKTLTSSPATAIQNPSFSEGFGDGTVTTSYTSCQAQLKLYQDKIGEKQKELDMMKERFDDLIELKKLKEPAEVEAQSES